jgi:hypothetical protein
MPHAKSERLNVTGEGTRPLDWGKWGVEDGYLSHRSGPP